MNKSKIILLLMFAASVTSAFAGVRPSHSSSSSSTKREQAAQVSAKAYSCPFKMEGAHYKPSRMSVQSRVAGLLGLDSAKLGTSGRKGTTVR